MGSRANLHDGVGGVHVRGLDERTDGALLHDVLRDGGAHLVRVRARVRVRVRARGRGRGRVIGLG